MPLVSKNFASWDAHNKEISTIRWSKTGSSLASGSDDCTVKLWNIEDKSGPRCTCDLTGHDDIISTMAWDPKNEHVIATCAEDRTLKIWDARSGKCNQTYNLKGASQLNMAWSPDSSFIAMGNKNDNILFLDVKKGKVRWQKDMHPKRANQFFFHPNGRHFFLSTDHFTATRGMTIGEIEVFDYTQKSSSEVSLTASHSMTAHNGCTYCISLDPTGRYFATGSTDSIISMWDANELICLHSHGRLENPIRGIAFSYDGKYLASTAKDQDIDIMNVETGELTLAIDTGDMREINDIAMHPHKMLLATTGDDVRSSPGTIKLYSVQNQK